jgi:NAD(P)-dependent dehydrogenase (short-subunit alcohol dehydrogenase family)
MSARTYLITGPTRGLGLNLVRSLAHRAGSPHLLLVGRAGAALESAAAEATSAGAPAPTVFGCDLGSLAEVRAASAAIADHCSQTGQSVDAVVANAALQMANATSVTEDGIETTFGVGVVAHHLLLRNLQPTLSHGAQIVLIGSGTHYGKFPATLMVPGPHWAPVTDLLAPSSAPDASSVKAGRRTYATSKLAVNYLCHEWNRRFGATLRANVYDPGLMPGTGLARQGPRFQQWAWRTVMPALRVLPGVSSPEHSADQLAALVTGTSHADAVNIYFEIGRERAASPESFNLQRERELFDALDARVGLTP